MKYQKLGDLRSDLERGFQKLQYQAAEINSIKPNEALMRWISAKAQSYNKLKKILDNYPDRAYVPSILSEVKDELMKDMNMMAMINRGGDVFNIPKKIRSTFKINER